MKKSIKDSYPQYAAETKKEVVDLKTYLKLSAEYNKFLIGKVLNAKKITLPSRFGTLQITGRKEKIRFDEDGKVVGLAPNWQETKKLWNKDPQAGKERKKIYHINSHTGGFRYTYFWSKARVLVENKTLYSLRMTRENKRAVNEHIEKGIKFVNKN